MISLGNLGESAVYHDLLKRGHPVYFSMAEGAKFDFISDINGKLRSIEVKSSATRNRADTGYVVKIKRSKRKKEEDFDNTRIDILAVYIEPLDKIIYFNAKLIKQKTAIVIPDVAKVLDFRRSSMLR